MVYPRWARAQERTFGQLLAAGGGVSELGLQASDVQGARLMGVWDHFYEDSAFSAELSTHYGNLPHVLQLPHALDISALPSDQHSAWLWQDVHPYVRLYAKWVVDEGILPLSNK